MVKALCVFCGQPNKISNEHVWGEWIGPLIGTAETDYLGQIMGEGKKMKVLHRLAHDDEEGIAFQVEGLNHKARIACKPCNSEWMSDLETSVQPILSPIIRDAARTTLDREQQALIATWATKTAMVAEYLGRLGRPIYYTSAERLWVKNSLRPPDDVHVWVGHSRAPHVCDGSTQHLALTATDGTVAHASLTTHAIRHFAFQVLSYRRAIAETDYVRFRNGPWDDCLLRIWPIKKGALVWPPPGLLSGDLWQTFCTRLVGLADPPGP